MNFILPESFKGPALHFSIQALLECKRNFLSERHIEMVYATLVAWGMHRSGKGGAKMPDYQDFKRSVVENKETLCELKNIRIECIRSERSFEKILKKLEELCFKEGGLYASKTKARVVSSSKALAHILPNLVPPIDREYTACFFGYNKQSLSLKKEKELFNEVMLNLYRLFKDPIVVYSSKRLISNRFSSNLPLPKLFDYTIIDIVRHKTSSVSKAFCAIRDRIVLCGLHQHFINSRCLKNILFYKSHGPIPIAPSRTCLDSHPRRAISSAVGTRLLRHRHRNACLYPCGRPCARGGHPRVHELGVGRSSEILLDQIAGATFRQPRGQRPRLRCNLLPAAVLRGGGGVRGGENMRMFVSLLQFLQFMLCQRQAHLIPASRRKHQRGMILY